MPVSDLRTRDPDRIGPYRVLGRLGAGGMGVVYLVQAGQRLGALKLIRPELADDEEFRVRFRREVEAGRAVSGPYTARFIDAQLDGPAENSDS
jgi:serine/threonine protein kinase